MYNLIKYQMPRYDGTRNPVGALIIFCKILGGKEQRQIWQINFKETKEINEIHIKISD